MLLNGTLVDHWLDWGAGHFNVHCSGAGIDCFGIGTATKEARVVPKSTPLRIEMDVAVWVYVCRVQRRVRMVGIDGDAAQVLFCAVGHLFETVRGGTASCGGFVGAGGGVVGGATTFAVVVLISHCCCLIVVLMSCCCLDVLS